MKKFKIKSRKMALSAGLVVLLFAVSLALAGGGPSLPRSLLAGGGSQVSSGAISLSSALGQPVAGSVGSGELVGASGFWVGTGVQPQPPPGEGMNVYLPIIIR